jgi:hypothetical protein
MNNVREAIEDLSGDYLPRGFSFLTSKSKNNNNFKELK